MYVKRNYGFLMTLRWSYKPFLYGSLYAAALTAIHFFSPLPISLPWQPISVIGIAVAFYLGFKNNSSYDRTWEARKIWGAIVNSSRTFGTAVITMIDDPATRKELIYRHVAWLTALRYQLRLSRSWEHVDERVKGAYNPVICEAYLSDVGKELSKFLSQAEIEKLQTKSNMATQILANQSLELERLFREGKITDFEQIRFHELIGQFYDEQGKSERIKNFPFSRQYASTALWLSLVFAVLIPFGMLDIFSGSGSFVWIAAPFSGLIIWVFFLMEKIGDYSENPFEGTHNDVPITSISRAIEIDLREMIDDSAIPEPVKDHNGFLM